MKDKIDQLLNESIKTGALRGVAVMVCNSGGQVYEGAFGVANNKPMDLSLIHI